jgi:hypothetical protein
MNEEQDREIDIMAKVAAILACLPGQMRLALLAELPQDTTNSLNLRLQHLPLGTIQVIACFDDLIYADDNELRQLLSQFNLDTLCCALIGAGVDLRQRFFDNMTNGVAVVLAEDIAYFSDETSRQVIESAQNELLKQANAGQMDKLVVNGIGEVMQQLHNVCEKTMALVIANCTDELAAAVLSGRMDRHRILLRLLQTDQAFGPDDIMIEGPQKVAGILACLRHEVRKPLIKQLASQQTVIDLAIELRKRNHNPRRAPDKQALDQQVPDEQAQQQLNAAINEITEKLQYQCEMAVAKVIVNCADEVAACILLQRQDRLKVLEHILQMEHFNQPYRSLSATELDYLLNLVVDDDL